MALGKAIGRLVKRVQQTRECQDGQVQAPSGLVSEGPRSAYELVTRRALEDLAKDFERLESKVDGVIFGVLLTFALEVWKSFR